LNEQKETITTREKLLSEAQKKGESEEISVGDNWLVKCLSHPSNRIVSISQSIIKELTCQKSIFFNSSIANFKTIIALPILFEIYYQSVSEAYKKENKNEVLSGEQKA